MALFNPEKDSLIQDPARTFEPDVTFEPSTGEDISPTEASESTKGLIRGAANLKTGFADFGGLLSEAAGTDDLTEYFEEAAQAGIRRGQKFPARIGSLAEAETPEDYLDFLVGGTTESLPFLASTVATGGLAGAGVKALGFGVKAIKGARVAGAFTSIAAPETGFTYREILQETGEKRPGLALAAGAVKGVLDTYSLGKGLQTFLPKSIRGKAASVLRDISQTALREGVTEAAQELVDIGAVRTAEDAELFKGLSSEDFQRVLDVAVLGATGGAAFGGAGRTAVAIANRVQQQFAPDAQPGETPFEKFRNVMNNLPEDQREQVARSFEFDSFEDLSKFMSENETIVGKSVADIAEFGTLDEVAQGNVEEIFYTGGVPWPSVDMWAETGVEATDKLSEEMIDLHRQDPEAVAAFKLATKEGASREEAFSIMEQLSPLERRSSLDLARRRAAQNNTSVEKEAQDIAAQIFAKWPKFKAVAERIGVMKMLEQMHYIERRETKDVLPAEEIEITPFELIGRGKQSIFQPEGFDTKTKTRKVAKNQIPVKMTVNGKTTTYGIDLFKLTNAMLRKTQASARGGTSAARFAQAFFDGISSLASTEGVDGKALFAALKEAAPDTVVYRLKKTTDKQGKIIPGRTFTISDLEEAHKAAPATRLEKAQAKLKRLKAIQKRLTTLHEEATAPDITADAYAEKRNEYKKTIAKTPRLDIEIAQTLEEIVSLRISEQVTHEEGLGFEIEDELPAGETADAVQPVRKAPIERGYSTTDNPTSEAFFNYEVRDELYEDSKDTTSYRFTATAAVDLYNSIVGMRETIAGMSDTKAQDAKYMENMYAKLVKQPREPVSKARVLKELETQLAAAKAKSEQATANEVKHAALDPTVENNYKESSQLYGDAERISMTDEEILETDWLTHEGFTYIVSQVERIAKELGLGTDVQVLTPKAITSILPFENIADILSGATDGSVIQASSFLDALTTTSEATGIPVAELVETIKTETGVDLTKGKYFLFVNPKMSRERTLTVMAHEMGHIVLFDALEKGTLTDDVIAEYIAWLDHINNNDPLVRELFKDRAQLAVKSLKASSLNVKVSEFRETSVDHAEFLGYLTDFHEWFADRVRNRLLDPTPPKGNFERGLEGVVKQLRTVFKMDITIERTVEDFTDSIMKRSKSRAWSTPQSPHETLQSWQEQIRYTRNITMSTTEQEAFNQSTYQMLVELYERTIGRKPTEFDHEYLMELAAMHKDDALGSGFNKAIRYGFDVLLKPAERKLVANATNSPYVKGQVSKLLRNNPEAWADAQASPEAMMAYAYQFWITGQVNLSKRNSSMFQKMHDFITEILGLVTDSENAEMLFDEFTTGNVYLRAQGNSEAQFSVKKAARETVVQRAVQDHLAPAWEKVSKSPFGYTMFSTATQRMYQTKNQWLIKLANEVNAKIGTQFVAEDMLTQRTQMIGRFTNMAYHIYEGKDDAFGQDVVKLLNEGRAFTANEKKVKGAAFAALSDVEQAAVRTQLLMAEMHRYMQDAGMKVGLIENYFPWVFDEDYVRENRTELTKLFSAPEFAEDIKKLKTTPEGLTQAIIDSRGYADTEVEQDRAPEDGHPPAMSAMNTRTLKFIDKKGTPEQRAQLAKFFSNKLGHTLNNYIEQAVKRTEYHRRFGDDKLETYLDNAVKLDPTSKDMELAKVYVDAVMGRHGYETNRRLAELLELDPPKPGEIINPKLQRGMGIMMVYQNVRVLSLSTLTSLVDPIGIAVRTGDVGIAYHAFKEGIRATVSHAQGNQEVLTDMAEMLGVIDRHMTVEALNWEYGGIYIKGTERAINEKFFRYIGLQAWTRATRVMGMEGGLRFIARHVNNPNQHSERLLGELNLRPEDIVFDDAGKVKILTAVERRQSTSEEIARDDNVRAALHRFIDGAILRPNATLRPIWASDPHFMLIFHLKSFMYSFHERILKRVVLEAQNGNMMPLLMFGMFIPFMMAGDMLRDFIQHGTSGNPQKAQWGMMEYIGSSVERSGMLGLGQIAADAGQDIKYGGLGYESFSGPSWQQAEEIFLKDNYDALKAVPTQNVWRYWTEQ